ncbi:unnamed protein product [Amoebophrya sp. A120]|nr:unnamed protein product [Amoebophrya sp. A120]|eukprot:GSA120T00018134001.1
MLLDHLDSFFSTWTHAPAHADEQEFLSKLVDSHYGLPSHVDTEKHLGSALSVLAQHSEHANEKAALDGVYSLAAKKWLPKLPLGDEAPVDPLQLQPSLNLPPEQEQNVLRHTLNEVLGQKVAIASKDLHQLDKMREILEKPQAADQAWQEALKVRVDDLQNVGGTNAHTTHNSTSISASRIESEVPSTSVAATQISPDNWQSGGSSSSTATHHYGSSSSADNSAKLSEELFVWKASQHQVGTNQQEPYVVVRDRDGISLQLLPMRSALAFGDNRELWHRDAEGHIWTPDKSAVVDVDSSGKVLLKSTQGLLSTGARNAELWKLGDDGTMTSVHGKEYLQFPGVVDSFVDTRLIDPVNISSNIPDTPEHPASFAIDDNVHHSWVAPQAGGEHLPLAGKAGLIHRNHPYLVVDAGETKYIESLQLDFTEPPKEFLVSGSSDGGHSWQKVFGTDLNTAFNLKVPIHDKFSHLKITFLEPLGQAVPHVSGGQFGVRHVAVYGKEMEPAFVGGYPIFGPVGHFKFEHLAGPLPDAEKIDKLLDLAKQLDVANSKLALAEERYEAAVDQRSFMGLNAAHESSGGGGFFGTQSMNYGNSSSSSTSGAGAGGGSFFGRAFGYGGGEQVQDNSDTGAAQQQYQSDEQIMDTSSSTNPSMLQTMEMSMKPLFYGMLAFCGLISSKTAEGKITTTRDAAGVSRAGAAGVEGLSRSSLRSSCSSSVGAARSDAGGETDKNPYTVLDAAGEVGREEVKGGASAKRNARNSSKNGGQRAKNSGPARNNETAGDHRVDGRSSTTNSNGPRGILDFSCHDLTGGDKGGNDTRSGRVCSGFSVPESIAGFGISMPKRPAWLTFSSTSPWNNTTTSDVASSKGSSTTGRTSFPFVARPRRCANFL